MPSVFNETIPENFGIAWQNYMNEQSRIVNKITMFQTRIKNGIIDVWWLYDDGGLSLLIPYLLTQEKSYLENAKLRIFTVTSNSKKVREEERNLATLLTKFRISFAEVKIISDTASTPSEGILTEFENIIFPFVYDDISEVNPDISTSGLISKTELAVQQDKTWKNLRISEQIHKYSSKSDLIVVTLPVPRKGLTNSCLYLAWIDIMSRKLPPTLFIRGNQQSVLTFYS
uniref:SLC12A transporter C-terminal domain-containing protein n=1 Tax=Panagrolaimus sp. JU765 TaxID=591449 RepID=A0AC34PVY2_9BILA